METVTESRCCQEIEQMAATMEAGVHSCITDHSGSRSDCLDVLVLRITYLAYKEQYGDVQQDGNRYRNMCSSLMLSCSQKQPSVDDDTRKWDWKIEDGNFYLDKSTVPVLWSLCSVIWRSNASMFGCSFVQAASIYCISSVNDTLLGLSGKGHHAPMPSWAILRIQEEYPSQEYEGSQSARVTELLGIILGLEAVPMLLDSLRFIWPLHSWHESGWLLQWFRPVCCVDFVHSSTASCIQSSMYPEETQFTFSPKHIKYVNNKNNSVVLINV